LLTKAGLFVTLSSDPCCTLSKVLNHFTKRAFGCFLMEINCAVSGMRQGRILGFNFMFLKDECSFIQKVFKKCKKM